jgi:hypothetical protein
MSKRSQKYIKMPWTGGVNDSVDSGLLPDNDLVQADNVTIGISGSRLKREGIDYFDQLTVPSISSATRSGSTVTVTFGANIDTATNDIFVVGEKINVQSTDAEYTNATATVVSIPAATQLTYTTAGAITPAAASATISSITRTASIVGMHDFWYYDPSSDAKNQYILAVNSDAQVFRYSINGERIGLTNKSYAVTFADSGDLVTLTAHGLVVGDAVGFTSITSTTGISVNEVYYVQAVGSADTFTLAATRGGSLLPLTTNGSGTLVSPQFTQSINSASFLTMNEKCLIAFDGIENFPKVFDPAASTTEIRGALGACPNAKFICEKPHLGRAWMNDKEISEQLYYSASYDFDKWNGYDDSGVLNIGFGDGDPDGINAIHPPFKGTIFCTKRNSVYRIEGVSPEDFQIIQVSTGIGGVGHQAVASIDLDDVAYVSYKGIHSLAATDAYGAFSGSFLSEKIQTAFSNWTAGRLKYTSAVYIPTLNSVFFSIASSDFDDDRQDSLWVFNTKFKEWHRWPNIQAKSLAKFDDSGTQKLLIGRYDGRIAQAQTGEYVDYTTGAIQYTVKSGTIYVDGNPDSIKAFKRLGFIFRPKGDYTFTATVKIDNFAQQAVSFSQVSGGALLGDTFTLGESILAVSNVLAPHMLPIDGYGRGVTVKIEQNATNQQVEIYGLVLEYDIAGDSQENIGSQDL